MGVVTSLPDGTSLPHGIHLENTVREMAASQRSPGDAWIPVAEELIDECRSQKCSGSEGNSLQRRDVRRRFPGDLHERCNSGALAHGEGNGARLLGLPTRYEVQVSRRKRAE